MPSRSPSPSLSSSQSPSPVHSEGERAQCSYCELWFESESEKDEHLSEKSSGCSKHKECFAPSQNYEHARDKWHDRCFVPGCDDDWEMSDGEVVEHVWREHTNRG